MAFLSDQEESDGQYLLHRVVEQIDGELESCLDILRNLTEYINDDDTRKKIFSFIEDSSKRQLERRDMVKQLMVDSSMRVGIAAS